jgi:hypothetical protein
MYFPQISLEDFRFRKACRFYGWIFTVYSLPQGFCRMPRPADNDIAGGDFVPDGPGQHITARQDAAAEQDHDIRFANLISAGKTVMVQCLNIPLSAKAAENIYIFCSLIIHQKLPSLKS